MTNNINQMNPMYGVYSEFKKILDTLVIKYSYLAEKYETFEIKKEADAYLSALASTDSFFTYRDYTQDELYNLKNPSITTEMKENIEKYCTDDGYLLIPTVYRNELLQNRRKYIIQNYEEKNEYYRKLNGFPPLNTPTNKYHYIAKEYCDKYGIDETIPIHKIQDYYNNITPGNGDYLISIIEGLGIVDTLKNENPNDEYLNYIGSTRIKIDTLRKSKNFQILSANRTAVSNLIFDEFVKSYEQARDYHVSTIFIREYRDIIPHYDQFIALSIMCMTIEIILNHQFKLGIDRKYYNDYTLKLLYDSYGIPYNMNIDEFTQQSIAQSLNTLIQKKSTDNVFYDITKILGFNDLKLYRYYLTKERKFDKYGLPVIAYTEKFNNDTGEFETIPDYKVMYDVYFQKVELTDKDFITAYDISANKESYETITDNDPFWWKDENAFKAVWETEYNFVESKYLSVGLSYKMTEIMYENIILLKLLTSTESELNTPTITLPKIEENLKVTLFDAIILLFCLMSKKHNLKGEIISIPTQVESVLDYLQNTDGSDEFLVNSFAFNLDMFQTDNTEGQEMISEVSQILDTTEAERFKSYIASLRIDENINKNNKITLINSILSNIKGLSNYLQYLMAKSKDRKTYEILKEFYKASYYSKEVKSIFTIPTLKKRTAKNYFEFLYHHNPKLYFSLFDTEYERQYNEHIANYEKYGLNSEDYKLDDYIYDIEYGNFNDKYDNPIDFTYSTLKVNDNTIDLTDDLIYYYIDHIISRLESYVNNLKFIYMINDTTTPLEDLLVKLINFFKSFTVDMLGIDLMYIVDLRTENAMKFFDEIKKIKKDIDIKDNINMSYNDIIHKLEATFNNSDKTLSFTDKVLYDAYISIAKDIGGNKYNEIKLSDMIHHIITNYNISMQSNNNIQFTDTIHTNANISVNDKLNNRPLFIDKISYKYYTD